MTVIATQSVPLREGLQERISDSRAFQVRSSQG